MAAAGLHPAGPGAGHRGGAGGRSRAARPSTRCWWRCWPDRHPSPCRTRPAHPVPRGATRCCWPSMAGLLAWAVEPTMRVWQAPPTWAEALAFSPVGGGPRPGPASGRQPGQRACPRPGARLARGARPSSSCPSCSPACSCSPPPTSWPTSAGRSASGAGSAGTAKPPSAASSCCSCSTRSTIVGGGWLIDGHWTRSWRLRALLLLSAVCASLTPQIASFGSGPLVAELPRLLLVVLLPLVAAAAMAGLWAQTFLLTGLMLDAIRGRRPAVEACHAPLARGCGQGCDLQLRLHGCWSSWPGCCKRPCSGRSSPPRRR